MLFLKKKIVLKNLVIIGIIDVIVTEVTKKIFILMAQVCGLKIAEEQLIYRSQRSTYDGHIVRFDLEIIIVSTNCQFRSNHSTYKD